MKNTTLTASQVQFTPLTKCSIRYNLMKRKEKIKIIREIQIQIAHHEKIQNEWLDVAYEKLGIDPNKEPEATILFDFLFNSPNLKPADIARKLWRVDTAAKPRT
jgi:hypothetical protein